MRFLRITLALLFVLPPVMAQEKTDGPTDEKVRKTYESALKSLARAQEGMGSGRLQESRQAGRRALPRLPETDDQTRQGTRRVENRRTWGRGNRGASPGTKGYRIGPLSISGRAPG